MVRWVTTRCKCDIGGPGSHMRATSVWANEMCLRAAALLAPTRPFPPKSHSTNMGLAGHPP